jgi:DNA polymerase V
MFMKNDQSIRGAENCSKSKKGGSRDNAGRKPKWGEDRAEVSMWSSGKFTLESFLEWCHKNKIKGDQFEAILEHAKSVANNSNNQSLSNSQLTMKIYSSPVSAGDGRTSSTESNSLDGDYENISVAHLLSPNPKKSFMVPVVGDSMKDIGLCSGHILVVESCSFARDGKIIVASVNDEIMVKRYTLKNNRIFLYSENSDYPPIEIVEQTFSILGIVRSCINNHF